jgi:DNA repair exonuclease SbcCD ATPase subunit/DNA repair exonuclease SbcCD nuclease subunit
MAHKIDVGFDKLRAIFHIGDIHIRNVRRHDEYTKVFDRFFKELDDSDDLDKSIIYIAGDVAHAKTEMSPELVMMISEFFSNCAKRCHTVIIAGNHDFNQNNRSRLDVISPIVDYMNNPRLHYLKKSGVYRVADVNLVHYGLLDELDGWEVPPNDAYNVGLFHGPVESSTTDLGFTLYDTNYTPETFRGCDLVLCGDIHKRQTVGEQDTPMVVYCGSLIQQNHGETLKDHGFIKWYFEDGKLEDGDFVDISNDHGYYTLEIDGGEVPDVSDMPKHPRLRISVKNTPSADLKNALAEVRRKYGVSDYTLNRLDSVSRQRGGESSLVFGDVTNIQHQTELIRDYLNRKFALSDDLVDKILTFNAALNDRLPEEDVVRNVTWKPRTLKFSNMFSYGEDNLIDFTDLNGIYGIFAPNRTGKSSIFDVILYCLFDKCSRAHLAEMVMNTNSTTFECELTFELGGTIYGVNRSARPHGKGLRVDVDFWKEDASGDRESLNGTERTRTNAEIRKFIGTYDDFIATTISLQKDSAIFIEKQKSARKDLLIQFMGINIFERLHKLANAEILDTSALIKRLKKINHEEQLVDFETKLADQESQLAESTKQVDALDKIIGKMREDMATHRAKIDENVGVEIDVDRVNERIKSLVLELVTQTDEVTVSKSELIAVGELLVEVDKEISDLNVDVDDLDEQIETYRSNTTKYERLKDRGTSLKADIERKLNQLKKIKTSHDYDPSCEFCVTNAKSHLDMIAEMELDISDAKKSFSELTKDVKDLRDRVSSFDQSTFTKRDVVRDVTKHKTDLTLKASRLDADASRANVVISEANVKLERLRSQVRDYKANQEQIANNTRLQTEIDQIRTNVELKESERRDENRSLQRILGEVGSLKTAISNINSEISELRELEESYVLYEYYLKAMHRDGIPSELIDSTLPLIEDEVNNILQQIVDFTFSLEVDGKDISGKIIEDGSSWAMEMASGMERFVLGLSLRIALMNVCSLPRSNFLVVDEGFGKLDSESVSSIFAMFDYMRTQFDFTMVISHLDVIRDMVDHIVELQKTDGVTKVVYP